MRYHTPMKTNHEKTLKLIFSDPVNGNIEWRLIEALRYRVKDAREFLKRIGVTP